MLDDTRALQEYQEHPSAESSRALIVAAPSGIESRDEAPPATPALLIGSLEQEVAVYERRVRSIELRQMCYRGIARALAPVTVVSGCVAGLGLGLGTYEALTYCCGQEAGTMVGMIIGFFGTPGCGGLAGVYDPSKPIAEIFHDRADRMDETKQRYTTRITALQTLLMKESGVVAPSGDARDS